MSNAEKNNVTSLAVGSQAFSLTPKTLSEAMEYADIIAKSDIVPPDYKGKSANVLVAVQMGAELGLPPLQALQNIAVINGRPCVYGDSLMAIARAHPACEYINETFDENKMVATCKAKRRGGPEEVRTYSQQDATTAGLWGTNNWKKHPKRMLQMRARGFAIRDVFADALRGIALAEEVMDYQERDVTPRAERNEPVQYPQELFEKNIPEWRRWVEAGKLTPDEIIAKVETVGPLSDEQKKRINDLTPIEGGQNENA